MWFSPVTLNPVSLIAVMIAALLAFLSSMANVTLPVLWSTETFEIPSVSASSVLTVYEHPWHVIPVTAREVRFESVCIVLLGDVPSAECSSADSIGVRTSAAVTEMADRVLMILIFMF